MRGGEGREYFCMLYEARRHMPSELGCLLSQGSWFDRPVLAPSTHTPPAAPPSSPTNTLLPLGLPRLRQWAWQLLWLCMDCAPFICVRVYWGGGAVVGGLLSDLNTSDIVVSPGRNSWSAGEWGGRGQG